MFEVNGRELKKYSSCSTIYIDDSTVSQPNLKNTIKAVALAIYFHIRNRDNRDAHQLEGRLLDIFDERLHPLTVIGPCIIVFAHKLSELYFLFSLDKCFLCKLGMGR